MGNANFQTGPFPHRVRPCAAMNSPSHSGHGSRLLPHRTHHGRAGHPFNDPRPIVNGIHWILHTGIRWRDLPERYGPWETVSKCFTRWQTAPGPDRRPVLDERTTKARSTTPRCIDGSVTGSGDCWGKKKPSSRPQLDGPKTALCKGRLTMRWTFPGRVRHEDPSGLRQPRFHSRHPSHRRRKHERKAFEPTMLVRLFHRCRSLSRGHGESLPTRVQLSASGSGAGSDESETSFPREPTSHGTST